IACSHAPTGRVGSSASGAGAAADGANQSELIRVWPAFASSVIRGTSEGRRGGRFPPGDAVAQTWKRFRRLSRGVDGKHGSVGEEGTREIDSTIYGEKSPLEEYFYPPGRGAVPERPQQLPRASYCLDVCSDSRVRYAPIVKVLIGLCAIRRAGEKEH